MQVALVAALTLLGGLVLGGILGIMYRNLQLKRSVTAAQNEAATIIKNAEEEKKRLVLESKEEALKTKQQAETELRDRRREVQRMESRIAHREEQMDKRIEGIENKERLLAEREKMLETLRKELDELKVQQVKNLELIAGLTMVDAKDQIMKRAEADMQRELAKRYYELEQQVKADADEKAKRIVTLAVHKLATDVVSETTTASVPLPNEEMKGRLIGREGRNIRAIEAATGVDLIIDDTPEAVTISCFDPIRKEVARIALANLIQDGRIHPARIEEVVEKAQKEVEEIIRKGGEQAIMETGVRGLPPELVKLVGRLRFRWSYGENMLKHAIEVSHLAGLLAAEIGADIQVAKAGGLLHDIGKALTHEVEGSHIEIGEEIGRRFNLPPAVQAAINEHHDDDRGSLEAFIVATADAMSAARPGSRRDSVEFYVKRLEALEDVANSFPGVEKSFAIQAGREVRIMVQPDKIDDIEATNLARNVVKKIEENLVYPGQIKVTVVRETRTVEYAK